MVVKNDQYDKEPELNDYVYEKVKMLQDDFCIKLTTGEVSEMYKCKNHRAVDIYVRGILNRKL